MSLTFLQLKQKLRRELWPAGEAKNLQIPHDSYFVAAMIDIARWVECVQSHNVSQYPACSTYWDNAKTVVEAPKGIISRVFTIANDNFRDKVFYWSSNFPALECWSNLLYKSTTPLNTGQAVLQQGFKFSESSTDSANGRARIGSWAIHRNRLYLAPWVQSNETIVVEWDGKKADWLDTDIVNTVYWTPSHEEAIKLYVRSQHELFYGDKEQSVLFKRLYNEKISDLIFDCREETRQQENIVCDPSEATYNLTQDELNDDAVPSEETDFVTCLTGDWGSLGQPLTDLAALIANLSPRKVIGLGDNVYAGNDPATLFKSYGDIPLYMAWGNHDRSDVPPGDLSALLALVDFPNNERYYTIVDGPVQFFILDSDPAEADGGYVDASTSTENSIMGQWLKVQLAMSTARWKVVITHHAPYSSDVLYTPGNRWMRWPFKLWGSDLVVNGHGHVFEDVVVDGLHYVTCGLGGHDIRSFGANTTGTILKQYNANYAFLKMTANCDSLNIKLIDRLGSEQYSYDLTK